MFILLGLMICGFIGGYYQLAILAVFLIVTGWCGVRDSSMYNIEQILCVTFFSGYIWIYTLVDMILKILAYETDLPIAALISLFGGAVFYLAACVIAKMLYDELRCNYQMVDAAAQPPGFMDRFGMGGQRQAQQVPDQPSAEEEPLYRGGNIPPNGRGAPLGGDAQKFKAFSGKPHSMQDQ
eukprot:CAMPEP_0197024256 /NCGR_PEP_ID=MMETSP1384-20130603/4848_1 /TAXON_ID=29189 /ORGANISM="Ammonia sp." /LENGTH=180 /DNA_ID=CAMNT_0042452611 /DNA_START=208 /DNA_END=750 /DNA_ORIENTATION=+